jgi:Sir2- and TIR-associating SLOG family
LFLGLSFDDPNLEYILSRIRILLGQNQRVHYCFFKRLSKGDFKEEEDFKYAVIRQELKAKDLKRYGISALWIDDYTEITEVLSAIAVRIKRSNIFISGAANSYEPINEKGAGEFVHQLSYNIASLDYKIISGYGLGIGSFVINGALDYKLSTNYRHLDDVLILRPFPQIDSGARPMKDRWTDYRKSMLENAGIAVYLFGNKTVDGKIVPSNGMIEEFEIACANGVVPIPVGATGYVAEELWNKLMAAPDTYYPNNADLLDAIKQLGNKSLKPGELITQILKAISVLQKQF